MLAIIIANALYLLYFVGKQKIIDEISQYSFKKKQLFAMAVLAHLLLSVCLPVLAFYMK
jgi:type IV secretory pathway TrbL component